MRPLLGWILVLALAGCGSSPRPSDGGAGGPGDNLAKIYKAYRQAQSKLNRPPRSLAELKPHLDNKDDEALFRSPRDGEAYEIVWGVDVVRISPNPTTPLVFAYEKKGQNGSRYVLTTTGPRLLSDAEMRQAQFPPGHKPKLD